MSTPSNAIESSGVRRASCRPTKVFQGQIKRVRSVAYFPDGRRMVSASDDKTVMIWDVESGGQVGKPLQHNSSVEWITVSPNGRRIAGGTDEGGLVVWDVLTQAVVQEIQGGVYRVAYSPDGRWITTAPSANEVEIRLCDADTGRLGRKPLTCTGRVWCIAFSPDGSRIAAGLANGYFQVIDILTGESVVGPIKGHTNAVSSIVYSPDGRLLVTASRDKSIRVWDSKSGVQVGKPMLGHKYGVDCISVTTDGRRIASGGFDKTVRVWDFETRLQVGDSFDAPDWVTSVAFSPDGRHIISGGVDCPVRFFDAGSLAVQGSSSPPATTPRIPPAPITQPIPPLRQQRQARTKSHNDASSINSSLLDLPAVVPQQSATQRPQERKPSVDDNFWDTESIRPPLQSTEPQQVPPHKPETSTAQPAASGRKWSRIRESWRHIRHRKPRVQANLSDCPPHPPMPLRERANTPASPEMPTNRQARRDRGADAQQNRRGSHSRTRLSRNQIEANVALGQADVRLAIAAPRGKKGRRFRARAQRGGARANSRSDTDSQSQDSDVESEYVDTGCLDAVCFGEYFRRRRYLQGR